MQERTNQGIRLVIISDGYIPSKIKPVVKKVA